ncbi:MAG: arginine repressor [Clostridiales bacterium]|nr:arginine repressor [Clostridiales bacterium]
MKVGRQAKIIELIGRYDIETQEELCEKLNAEGYDVTQATVSRDIRALKLTKVTDNNGRSVYKTVPGNTDFSQKYLNILKNGFISMDMAQNILVIKTVTGMAMAVATTIDAMAFKDVLGCIAGDDTIMVAVRTVDGCLEVMKKIRDIVDD